MFSCNSRKGKSNEEEVHAGDSGLYTPQLSRLTDSIKAYPDSADLYFERGKLFFETEDFEHARKDMEKAIVLNPLISAYYTALGQLYLSQQFPDSAVANFSKALQVDPVNQRARLQLAFILWQQKSYSETLLQTDTLLEQDPGMAKAMGLRSQVYETLGDTDKALKEMKKVIGLPLVSYDALMRMGDLLLDRDQKKALSFYQKAAKKDTAAGEPYYCIGLIYEKSGDISKAKKAFTASVIRDPHYILTYMHLGNLYKKAKNWEKAKEIYTLAIKTNITSSEAYFQRGVVNEHLKDTTAAVVDYVQALAFDDKNEKAKTALAKINDTN